MASSSVETQSANSSVPAEAVPATAGQDGAEATKQTEAIFALTVRFPNPPSETQIHVSTHEQVQDLRQAITDSSFAVPYSCFHLEHEGKPINNFIDLSDVPGIVENPEVVLVEDPYTDKDARLHILRVRDILGLAGNRVDPARGIDAGVSLFDAVLASESAETSGTANAAFNKHLGKTKTMAEYSFGSTGDIQAVLAPARPTAPRPVRSIALSHWSPPPHTLQNKGHLMYLVVSTNEGEQYHITSHVSGFFVNQSSNHKFNPLLRPGGKDCAAHSLLELLSRLSPSFDATMEELQEFNKTVEPLALFPLTHAIPANPWFVPAPAADVAGHLPDPLRPQENALTSSIEGSDNLRDWNEEFQSTKELPRDSIHDRIFRERLGAKLSADYVDAAVRGSVLLARGELAPLNPTESTESQIFVWNNIFFSYGADGVGTFVAEGGDEAARVATGKDVIGVRTVNQMDIPGLYTAGTVVVDYMGKRIVGQSIVPGIFRQRDPGEHQIDYGGVEGKDVVTTHEAFEPLLKQLSRLTFVKPHPVWDKEKKRHDLQASIETKGLIGTDGRKYVLDLYRITPLDIGWLDKHWQETVIGDDEKSVAKPAEKNYPHRMTTLRPELLDALYRHKTTKFLNEWRESNAAKKAEGEAENGVESTPESPAVSTPDNKTDNTNESDETDETVKSDKTVVAVESKTEEPTFSFELNPDAFTGQEPQTEEEREQMDKDEADVREACAFLVDDEIPRFITEYSDADSAFPVDGVSLTQTFHRRGINMRYLGLVASKTSGSEDSRAQVIFKLVLQEMVSRAVKHIGSRFVKAVPSPLASACISHLLNCLLGSEANPLPQPEVDGEMRRLYSSADLEFEKMTPSSLRDEIVSEVELRYRFTITGPIVLPGRHFSLLREVSLKLGLQLSAREYAFDAARLQALAEQAAKKTKPAPVVSNGKSNGVSAGGKKKKGGQQHKHHHHSQSQQITNPSTPTSPLPVQTFHPDDVLNFVPIVKAAAPKSLLAEEAFEAGRISIQQNDKELGSELLFESLSLYEQIYGILHPECARMYLQLSNIYHQLGENGGAVELARKAVIIFERTLGVDCVETIQAYMNLSLHEHSQGHPDRALMFTLHALELWKLLFGLDHPDAITAISNSAIMLQAQRLYHESRVWFEKALEMSVKMFGAASLPSGTLFYQLSQALAFDKDPHAAVNKMREAYRIFKDLFGEDDSRTRDAEAWLQQLTQAAVKSAKSAKMLQDAMAMQRMKTLVMKPRSVGVEGAKGPGGAVSSQDGRHIDELVKYIEGGEGKKAGGSKKNSQNPKLRGRKVQT